MSTLANGYFMGSLRLRNYGMKLCEVAKNRNSNSTGRASFPGGWVHFYCSSPKFFIFVRSCLREMLRASAALLRFQSVFVSARIMRGASSRWVIVGQRRRARFYLQSGPFSAPIVHVCLYAVSGPPAPAGVVVSAPFPRPFSVKPETEKYLRQKGAKKP